jgi:mannose-1-phosphate guanylyltransferase/mannose-6-phosphate isomerase
VKQALTLGTCVAGAFGKNTAPALTLAALAATENGADPVLVVTPADQTVANNTAFTQALQAAIVEAASGKLVILGITPTQPETGYGYIQTHPATADGASSAAGSGTTALLVKRFVEKPDHATAAAYLAEGGYYWNAGMFVLKASVWLQALEAFRPDILAATRAAWVRRTADCAVCQARQGRICGGAR